MKRHIRYAAYGMRSALFWTALGCLLSAGLASAKFQPASAARSGASPQKRIQRVRPSLAAPLAAKAQSDPRFTSFESGSALEIRDGQLSCREATEDELQALRRNHGQRLRVLRDEAVAPNATEQAQPGLKLILRGTPQFNQFPEAKAAFLRAARAWESLIQNPITVVIDVDFGPTFFGEPFPEDVGGLTDGQTLIGHDFYSEIRAALISSAGSPQEAALYNALPADHLPTNQGPAREMIFTSANLRALGEIRPVADPEHEPANWGPPPRIGFNSAVPYDFDPGDGIKPKRADFTAVAIHEIGHALGFDSEVGRKELRFDLPPTPALLDIFRFRPGVTSETFGTALRILSSGGEQVFFGGGAELPLSTGRNDASGGDLRQPGHWKDYFLTRRYMGVMDPITFRGYRYEMTANDLEAFERIGYRVNSLPNPREADLKLDDGTVEDGSLYDGLIVVNRLTPPSYPAILRKLRIMVPLFQDTLNPTGKPITLWIAAGNDANGEPPTGDKFTRIETTIPSAGNEMFLEFSIPNGPTINAGDFYVGYQAPSPHMGAGFALDNSAVAENRSFYSIDNGATFAHTAENGDPPANAMIRAVVAIGGPEPTPTPTPVPTPMPTPSPVNVALTSGVAQDGYIDKWGPLSGYANGTQYTIQVPSGATQLKIDVDANTDLDFFGRRGARVAIEGGYVTYDFKVETDEYHETLILTPTSAPALRAGVYYLMLLNYGPGPSTFKITATVTPGTTPAGNLANVSAANFRGGELASDMIVAAFGEGLATGVAVATDFQLPTTLLGTTVKVTDSQGVQRAALLLFVSPTQINYLMPVYTALGPATVTVTSGAGAISTGATQIVAVAPGLFTANGDGQGAPAAYVLRFRSGVDMGLEPVVEYDAEQRRFAPRPIDLGEATDQVFLVLYGVGIRNRQSLNGVSLNIGGVVAPPQYAGTSTFPGVDQINALLPRSLIGRGELDLVLVVDGKTANTVKINIK